MKKSIVIFVTFALFLTSCTSKSNASPTKTIISTMQPTTSNILPTNTTIPTNTFTPEPTPINTREVLEPDPGAISFTQLCRRIISEKGYSSNFDFIETLEEEKTVKLYLDINNEEVFKMMQQGFDLWKKGMPIDWTKCVDQPTVFYIQKGFSTNGIVITSAKDLQVLNGIILMGHAGDGSVTKYSEILSDVDYTDPNNWGDKYGFSGLLLANVDSERIDRDNMHGFKTSNFTETKSDDVRVDPFPSDMGIQSIRKLNPVRKPQWFMIIPKKDLYDKPYSQIIKELFDQSFGWDDSQFYFEDIVPVYPEMFSDYQQYH